MQINTLSILLLVNFFSDGTKLHNANCTFKSALQESINLFFLIKCYGEQMIQVYEMIHSEMIIICKELKQPKKFFNTCKNCLKDRRIALQGKFVFTTKKNVVKSKRSRISECIKKYSKTTTKTSNSNNLGEWGRWDVKQWVWQLRFRLYYSCSS